MITYCFDDACSLQVASTQAEQSRKGRSNLARLVGRFASARLSIEPLERRLMATFGKVQAVK
jgi:hypothetical protein